LTVYTISTDTFWSTNSGASGDGSTYAQRKAVPADITGITAGAGTLYIVRETADLTRTATGSIQVSPWITITGDAVAGVYLDDPAVTYALVLSGCGQLEFSQGNISYIFFGMSDKAHTVNRTASTWTMFGEDIRDRTGFNPLIFMYKCEVGVSAGTHYRVAWYGGMYLYECYIKGNAGFYWTASTNVYSFHSLGLIVWHNMTFVGDGGYLVNGKPVLPYILILGSFSWSGFGTLSNHWFANVFKCRSVFPVVKDADSTAIEDAYSVLFYTGSDENKKIPSDFWTKRMTDSDGRPEVPDGTYTSFDFSTSQTRNVLRSFSVPYSYGRLQYNGYIQGGTYDPAVALISHKNGYLANITTDAMASDYGTAGSPTTITLLVTTTKFRFDGEVFA